MPLSMMILVPFEVRCIHSIFFLIWRVSELFDEPSLELERVLAKD